MALVERKAVEDMSGYLSRLLHRCDETDKKYFTAGGAVHEHTVRVERLHGAIINELQTLQVEAEQVEKDLHEQVHRTRQLIHTFKNAIRAPEMQRLKERVEHWNGENYIRRSELVKMLSALR